MHFTQIYRGLDALDLTGNEAREAARLGFLEWTFALDDVALAPEAARDALDMAPPDARPSPAAEAFLAYLDAAADARFRSGPRRGGRRRSLN